MYVTAFFTLWIWEHYVFILQPEIYPYPPVPHEGWFWSFLVIIRTTRSDYRILLFWDYWFNVNIILYHEGLSGWLGIFIFQILAISMALITIHRKNEDKWLGTVTTAVSSIIAPILCIHQRFLQSSYRFTKNAK
jgi:hypothetical protein